MSEDLDIMARTLYGEAEARDEEDARAIACVIMNRVEYPNWPDTVREVCLQPYQFSCWNNNEKNKHHRARIMAVDDRDPWFVHCRKIAADAIAGKIPDFTGKATHYYADYISKPAWAKKGDKRPCFTSSYGKTKHYFFNDIDTPPPKSAREALDQIRPLRKEADVKANTVATVGAAGSIGTELVDQIEQAKDAVGGMMFAIDWMKYVFVGLLVAGLLAGFYIRYQKRKVGEL